MSRSGPVYEEIHAAWRKHEADGWLPEVRLDLWTRTSEIERSRHTELYAIRDAGIAIKFGVGVKPRSRLAGMQTGNPRPLTLLGACPGSVSLERFFHEHLAPWRMRGEWFFECSQTLAIVELILAAEDLARDLVKLGDEPNIAYTLGSITLDIDAVLGRTEAAAA